MGDFTFTSPDGKSYTVSGPEGATKEQAWSVLQKQLSAPTGAMGTASAAAGGLIGGIPVVGPALKKGAQYAAGGIRSLITGKPFSEELGKVEEYAGATEKQHPTAETIGEVGGGIAGTAMLGAAAPAAMGMSGTLPEMIGAGAASGAGIGGLDAAARGQNPLVGAGVGAAGGAAGPVIARGVTAAAQPLVNTYRGIMNPTEEAARRAAFAAAQDTSTRRGVQAAGRPEQGLTVGQFHQAQQGGQPVMALDTMGETGRALARSAANTSPVARETLNNPINQRFEQQSGRLTDWLRQNFHYPDAKAQQEALDNVSRTVNQSRYNEAFQRGSHDLFMASPKLQQMAGSDEVSAAMGSANKAAHSESILSSLGMAQTVGKPVQTTTIRDLRYWDQVHKQLQDMAIRAGHGTNESRRIGQYDRELKSELDRLVPSYAKARAGAASFFRAENSLEAGQKAVTMKGKNEEIRKAMEKMAPQERQLFRDGYVDRLMSTIRESGNRRNVADKLIFSDAGRERLAMAVGEQKTRELEAFVHVENVMDAARKAVQGNSKTAQFLAEAAMAGGVGAGTELYQGISAGDWTDPRSITNAMLMFGVARGKNVVDQRVANEVARLLTSGDTAAIQRAMMAIANHPRLFAGLRNFDAAVGRVLAGGATPQITRRITVPLSPQNVQGPTPYGGPQQ